MLKGDDWRMNRTCPIHRNRELSDSGYCMDCGDYPLRKKEKDQKDLNRDSE